MTREAELRKGCGKCEYLYDTKGNKELRWFCPTCQAKLEIFAETNNKWKQAVEKLLERKFFTNEGSEVVAVYTVKEIFGGLAE